MAVAEIKNINELLDQLNTRSIEDGHYKWTSEPIEPLTTYSISSGGTLSPSYGAVPNMNLGQGITNHPSYGANISPVWTSTGTGGYTIGQPSLHIGQSGKVLLQGESADLVINDKSLKTWMEKVEERLNILTPNPELEKEWDDLCRLGERYRKLEKKCHEKAAMWKQLKSMPKPDIK